MDQAFEEAYKDCLKNCFAVLEYGMIYDDPVKDAEAADRFRKCCAVCTKARLIAQMEKET